MSRRRKQAYRSKDLEALARQLLYAPALKRAQVVRHAERLYDQLDTAKNYPIDFLVYRLTERRVPPSESVMLVGEALRPDLLLLIDALSRSIDLPPDENDPGETTAELAGRLGVSTKTIGRWRAAGLRWRWVRHGPGERPSVVIPRSAWEHFADEQPSRVAAAVSFDRLGQAEKGRLIRRAQRLADATDATPHAILTHLARRSGRSVETLRQMIVGHDRANPLHAVFSERAGPLTTKQKRVIARAYRLGIGVAVLRARFRKARSTIYRAIHETRAEQALAVKFQVVPSPIFDREDADEVILRPIGPSGEARRLSPSVIGNLPDALRVFYDRPITPDPIFRSWVVRYNYLKHRAQLAQAALREQAVRAADLDRFDELCELISQSRAQALVGMLPVVLSVVRRQMNGKAKDRADSFATFLLRGNVVLSEEVDRFDASRSHRFESVLTNRLLRVLAWQEDPGGGKATIQDVVKQLEQAGLSNESR